MDGKPPDVVIDTEKKNWCMTCKKEVGEEKVLQHINPGNYPDAIECEECDHSHFFYFHRCPECHKPTLIPLDFYQKFLPLKDGEMVTYCDCCDDVTKVRVKKVNDMDCFLCERCYDEPFW